MYINIDSSAFVLCSFEHDGLRLIFLLFYHDFFQKKCFAYWQYLVINVSLFFNLGRKWKKLYKP